MGNLLLALPRTPLTLGNAVVTITHEHNRLFPGRPISERTVSISTGLTNLAGAALGDVPMCYVAGGVAGHVRFGARTGGTVIILGGLLLVPTPFYSDSVATVLRLFPAPVLGVILLFAGFELVRGVRLAGMSRAELGLLGARGHVGLAFVVGLALQYPLRLVKPGDGASSKRAA